MGVVAQEVDQLADTVDLGLVDVLALAEHHGGAHQRAVLGGDEFGNLEQDGSAHRPVGLGPLLAGLHGCVDRHLDLFRAGLVVGGQHVMVVVRHHHFAGIARADLLAADDQRDIQLDGFLAFQLLFERNTLGRALEVSENRLIGRHRERIDSVSHTNIND